MSARVKNMFLMKTDTINTPEIILVKRKKYQMYTETIIVHRTDSRKTKTLFTECCNSFIIIRNKSLKKQKVRDQVLQLKNTSSTVRHFSLCRNLHWKADACCHILPLFSNLMACFTCKYYSFQLLNSVRYSFLMMLQMLSPGERSGLQAGLFITETLLLCRHAVVLSKWFSTDFLKHARPALKNTLPGRQHMLL